MSIQFTCVSCGKPIEIDDQWAMRLVECPFCHDTVRAPGMTTLPVEDPPLASPVSPDPFALPIPEPAPAPGAALGAARSATGSRNTLAIVSLVLACLALMLLIGLNLFTYGTIAAHVGVENPTQEQVMQALQTAAEKQEPWALQLVMIAFGFFGTWLAAIVCSIIAITRRARRPLAIAALAVSSLPFLLMLVGLSFA